MSIENGISKQPHPVGGYVYQEAATWANYKNTYLRRLFLLKKVTGTA